MSSVFLSEIKCFYLTFNLIQVWIIYFLCSLFALLLSPTPISIKHVRRRPVFNLWYFPFVRNRINYRYLYSSQRFIAYKYNQNGVNSWIQCNFNVFFRKSFEYLESNWKSGSFWFCSEHTRAFACLPRTKSTQWMPMYVLSPFPATLCSTDFGIRRRVFSGHR